MRTICMMRDIYKALAGFETQFEKVYGLSLNEAMILCALQEAKREMTSTDLSARTEMGPSHTSKVIRTVEEKGLIKRTLGEIDKRQMYFSLTPEGEKQLEAISLEKVEVPEMLKPLL
ncbi:MarR family winged helix-turn-helix transcriptional regulator [Bacteroides sp.]